jgi:S1-C subfamily serine protease
MLAGGMLALASLACTVALFDTPGSTPPPAAVVATPRGGQAQESLSTPLPEDVVLEADAEELLLINVYERVNPAVVNIDVSAEVEEGELAEFGSGSGFVLDTEGYIVTNYHVVAEADEVRVTFSDGMVLVAEVLGTDPFADLSALKVTPPENYELVPVELGDSDTLKVGQRVIAIGNPFGLSGSMTVGIVSGVGRTLPSGVVTQTGLFSNPLIIQTDAAINPGNSGGPLLDSHGRVIGVNVAIRSTSGLNTGIGFAVPVNTVKRIVPQLIENGKAEYPYLGISSQSGVSLAELAEEFDLPVRQGVLIANVALGSGAAKAGLRGGERTVSFRGGEIALGGDIIIAIDGVPINNFDELLAYLVSNTDVGQEIIVTIVRDGETLDVPVTLTARPDS